MKVLNKAIDKFRVMTACYNKRSGMGSDETARYWTSHNVTSHYQFPTAEDSLLYLDWRNDQYYNYIQLMPVSEQDSRCILDYGCGPGNDLVGFGVFSKPAKLVGVDISGTSLAQAKCRLALHGIKAELIKLKPAAIKLPFNDNSFDYIHASGVLHHTPDPLAILQELRRILKPGGSFRVMIYNYESIWVHLYVAYQRSILQGLYAGLDILDQFRHSTDGPNCPIANCYRPQEWISICANAGFNASFLGAAVSMHEMDLLKLRYAAIQDLRLRPESRKFLLALTFDSKGYPMCNGHYAGIDACFLLAKEK